MRTDIYKVIGHGRKVLGYTSSYKIDRSLLFTELRKDYCCNELIGGTTVVRTDDILNIKKICSRDQMIFITFK